MTDLTRKHLQEAAEVLNQFLNDEANLRNITRAGQLLASSLQQGQKILSCGNGGSMSDSMHFAEELVGKFREERSALPAIALGSDPAMTSCIANDFGYEHLFERQLEAYGNEGDVLVGISTSGNSENVVKAIETARQKNMQVIGLTGKDGGKMAGLCDVEIRVPHHGYADRIQEIHIKVIHILIAQIEEELGLSNQ